MMRAPLRIALTARAVYPWHGYGGLERHVFDLVRHLALGGITPIVITRTSRRALSPAEKQDASELLDAGVTFRWVAYRTFPLAGRRGTTVLDRITAYPIFGERAGALARKLASSGEIDLVHGLGASALGYARYRARGAGVPFVFNPQGLEEFGATSPRRAGLKRLAYRPLQSAVRLCARAADRVIATDRALVPAVLRHLDVPEDRVRLLPNAVDLERCDALASSAAAARMRRRLGLTPTAPLLLSVGRLEENKGFHVLVEALEELAREHPGLAWSWMLAGDGPYRRILQRLVSAARLEPRVIFTGRLSDDDLHGAYEAATVFVHPTLYEGSSLVTLEAMAHRRAIVATTAGGLPDKVRPGINGWLVAPGSASQLSEALVEAMGDETRLRSMGERSRQIVEQEFAWPAAIRALLAVYGELVS